MSTVDLNRTEAVSKSECCLLCMVELVRKTWLVGRIGTVSWTELKCRTGLV